MWQLYVFVLIAVFLINPTPCNECLLLSHYNTSLWSVILQVLWSLTKFYKLIGHIWKLFSPIIMAIWTNMSEQIGHLWYMSYLFFVHCIFSLRLLVSAKVNKSAIFTSVWVFHVTNIHDFYEESYKLLINTTDLFQWMSPVHLKSKQEWQNLKMNYSHLLNLASINIYGVYLVSIWLCWML